MWYSIRRSYFISCIYHLRYSYQQMILTGNRDRRGTNATSAELGTLKMCETTFITDATHVWSSAKTSKEDLLTPLYDRNQFNKIFYQKLHFSF